MNIDAKHLKIYAAVAAAVVVLIALFRNNNSGASGGAGDTTAWLQSKALDAQTSVSLAQITAQSNQVAMQQQTQRTQGILNLVDSLNTNSIGAKELGYANTLATATAANTTALAVEKQKSADYGNFLANQLQLAQVTAASNARLAGITADSQSNAQLLNMIGGIANAFGNAQTQNATVGGGTSSSGIFGSGSGNLLGSIGSNWGSLLGGASAGGAVAGGAGALAGGADVADLAAVAALA